MGAVTALVLAGVFTSIWYMLGNPFGIDNMFVAVLTPGIVLGLHRMIYGPAAAPSSATEGGSIVPSG